MDTIDAISTKLDIREFSSRHVPDEIKRKILEAARLTGSSMNSQHWRFVVVQETSNLKRLAEDSNYGGWVANADFAIMVLTDPKVPGSVVDAGRVLQDMQLAAWNLGVASGMFTGTKGDEVRRDFGLPKELSPTVVLGFGYPRRRIVGKKNRKPLQELVYSERYGRPLGVQ